MTLFTCYRLRPVLSDAGIADFDDFVEMEEREVTQYGPVSLADFTAKLYVMSIPAHSPEWTGFLGAPFPQLSGLKVSSSGALLVVRLDEQPTAWFGYTFGTSGRFLLRSGSWERSYGLRTALNIIYPATNATVNESRLLALDAKRRSGETVRSRRQASRATTFESFDLDRYRDVIGGATGRPSDSDTWGTRVDGGDAVHFSAEVSFEEIGARCRAIMVEHDKTNYRDRFSWLDNIRPVTDPELRSDLEAAVINSMRTRALIDLDLAPPEIIDWTQVDGFRYHFEGRVRPTIMHPDLRLGDYLSGLGEDFIADQLDASFLKSRHISAISADGHVIHRWSVWRCLTGEYALDGEFFSIARGYEAELNAFIKALPESTVELPSSPPTMREDAYNRLAVDSGSGRLLLDRATVTTSESTTAVEICDILTSDRQLIHIKRHLGSRDLSHLFSQGFVSADLIQRDRLFREQAQSKVHATSGNGSFAFFEPAGISTSSFEVVYGIIADWRGRSAVKALPFFSKINLRRTVQDLRNRGYRVGIARIGIDLPKKSTTHRRRPST